MSVQAPATEAGSASGAPLRLGLNVGLLPWEARWFYLEAVGTAVRRNDRWALDHVQPAEELARLLEIASGSQRVVEIGAQTGWTALALAAADPSRSVISFRRPGASQGPSRYAHLVDAGVRERVGSCELPAQRASSAIPGPADLVHVDLSPPYADAYSALFGATFAVRPGGLVVVSGGGELEALALVEELDLEASTVDGLVCGRKPLEQDWSLLELGVSPSPADLYRIERRTGRRRMRLLALALAGSLVGAGAGLVLPLGDSLFNSENQGTGDSAGPVRAATVRVPAGLPRQPASPHRRPARGRSDRGTTAFAGTGPRKLGTLRVDEPLYMRWSTTTGSFRIVSETWGFRPSTPEGRLLLSPGAYRRFEVKGDGKWRLDLTKP
jgi:methyltransferase family protein